MHHEDAHPEGLGADLKHLLRHTTARRQALRMLGLGAVALSPVALIACGGGGDDDTASTTTITGGGSTASCSVIPSETAGPYPGDGTQSSTLDILTVSGVVRSDIRSSIGSASGAAEGVLLTVVLELVSASSSCATALANQAVYLWHCTREGGYSMYSSSVQTENFLRGVQVSDSAGKLSFTTVFPGCYSGRWPHVHFEIFDSLADATTSPAGDAAKISQLALPEAACREVYGVVAGYDASLNNLNQISLASDNVFGSDQAALQLTSVTGDAATGYTATLRVVL
jgi:protocatechuate 3,4-dioxygenase beta subunit